MKFIVKLYNAKRTRGSLIVERARIYFCCIERVRINYVYLLGMNIVRVN